MDAETPADAAEARAAMTAMAAPSGRTRADLLALTPDTLAALTNRGLVKRASKDLDAGRAPVLTIGEDGRVRADYAGAAVAELPPGAGLDNGSCGCGATGVCRHLIGLVLAYQRTASGHGTTGTPAAPDVPTTTTAPTVPVPPGGVAPSATGPATAVRPRAGHADGGTAPTVPAPRATGPAPAPDGAPPTPTLPTPLTPPTPPNPPAGWSPGAFDDETLTAAVGARAVTAARRTARRGYTARIHRAVPAPSEPVAPDTAVGPGPSSGPAGPWVELPTCTVRFPVPGEIGYALTDAAEAVRGEMVALAVWAFRAADEAGTGDGPVEVHPPSRSGGATRRGVPSSPGTAGRPGAHGHPGTTTAPSAAAPPAAAGTAGTPGAPRPETAPAGPTAQNALQTAGSSGTAAPGSPDPGARPPGTRARTRAATATPGVTRADAPEPLPADAPATPAPTTPPPLATALALADDLLLDGAAHAGPVLAAALRRTAKSLTAASLHWPAAATAELSDQLAAYTARDAAHDPLRHAALLAELHARHRAAGRTPGVLGEREAAETPLRRVRLTALGCRLSGTPEHPVTQTFFAHPEAGVVVVLHKTWQPSDRPWGSRRVLGTTLASLAAGSVVSETARRTASRALTLTRGRLAVTTVTPLGPTAWSELPSTLLVRDLAAHAAEWDGRPPRLVRPRVEAETVRVVEVSEVTGIGYDPAAQRLEATVLDAAGNTALLSSPHEPMAPAALDALAAALAGGPRYVAGALHRDGGGLRITPYAVAGSTGSGNRSGPGSADPGGITVPHLAAGEPANLPLLPGSPPPDPVAGALGSALAALADAAHHGLRHLTGPVRTTLARSADDLARTGLAVCATAVRRLLDSLPGLEDAPARWTDAQIRLLTTAELHRRG
ncbi:hypothetical protein [Streptomyces xinghaiensis]|uniref:hypothetical protein n=1 Tax=Streptomyces xinghaiensis TaxID=1038928 RepID=UPI002E105D4E|nr:hypothetical protein OG463_02960 [Streptomyces xinghaiensis]